MAGQPGRNLQLQSGKNESPISYNLGFTDQAMVICPRISEGQMVTNEDGDFVGPVALNGTLLAGTLLVKSNAEWDALRKDGSKLMDVLSAIGIPPMKSQQDGRL
jgi:ATP adenylyltransferase